MAKKKSSKTNSKPKMMTAQKNVSMPVGLDAAARAHARLLVDPCSAPLAHPIFDGDDGGILIRSETDFIFFAGTTETGGTFTWSPGGIGVVGSAASNVIYTTDPGGDSSIARTTFASPIPDSPGLAYLVNNSEAVTCVAACMQVYWPGTENARSGIVSYGNVPARTVDLATTLSSNSLVQVCNYSERTPNNKIEFRWRPGAGDHFTTDPGSPTPDSEFAKKTAMTIVARGLPPGIGLRLRLVAVYQYAPKVGLGIVNSSSRAMSNNTFDQVLNYLDRMGDWIAAGANAADKIANAVPYVAAVAYGNIRPGRNLISG